MSHFLEQLAAGANDFAVPNAAVMVPRLLAATTIGAVISLRPWRWLLRRPLPKSEMVQSQVLLCTAAAVITVVIGDSVAKAFGLVGLGGFVRFRSGLKDPRDASILFLLIGLGMACGHGSLGLAAAGAGFVALLLFGVDLFGGGERQVFTVAAESDDPVGTEAAMRKVLSGRNVLVRRCALDLPKKRLELELEGSDPANVAQALSKSGPALHGFKWTLVPGKPGKDAGKEPKEAI